MWKIFRSLTADSDRIRHAAEVTLGLRHHDVQVQGGLAMHRGCVVEMQTGEGKTLTATIPAALHAQAGRSVLIATSNDYLARRDAEWMEPVYRELGLSVGCIQSGQSREERQRAYARDITYGTAREFGFDFLKDRLELRRRESSQLAVVANGPVRVQREPGFLLLDEADSLLIDEARTPLILSGPVGESDPAQGACYRWASSSVSCFGLGTDLVLAESSSWPAFTSAGRAKLRSLEMPPELAGFNLTELQHFLERAAYVARSFQRDRHYVVIDGQVQIVDESTGRIQPGRTWNDGLHQAVEAREGLTLTAETGHLARVTMQEFVQRFPEVAGMTGTAREAAWELRGIYGLPVRAIPPHRKLQRVRWSEAVFSTREEKWAAIADETRQVIEQGRAVLIGTPTIAASQELATSLEEAGMAPVVLNALNPEGEAEIIAQAGGSGRVTIATNMAGRGTDIRLSPLLFDAGGLHVIGTELHSASRIDRQLEGRCGRQGDPGTWRQYLSLDDGILPAAYGEERAAELQQKFSRSFDARKVASLLRKAQSQVEQTHAYQRQDLMQFDRELRRATEALGLDPVLDAVD